jgi:hypothetical protein
MATMTWTGAAGDYLGNDGGGWSGGVSPDSSDTAIFTAPDCFGPGTLIRTARGEAAVDNLQVGELVMTASGAARPIVWLDHRTWRRDGTPRSAWPVRVLAGTFGEGAPARDLILSPTHAVCGAVLSDVLIPVASLVNGATIAPVAIDEIDYWRVELGSHDLLLAEGLRAESYLDRGHGARFDGEAANESLAGCCKPLIASGPIVETAKIQLAARAEELGWRRTRDMDPHLIADGVRIEPEIEAGLARFRFPARARQVELVSATFNPAQRGESADDRDLGLSVSGIEIGDLLHPPQPLSLDHPALARGFHPQEAASGVSWRWTAGKLPLPPELWSDRRGQVILRLSHNPGAAFRWIAPAVREAPSLSVVA